MNGTDKRARTVVAQSRVDPRSLATIARYFYNEHRVWIHTTSGLIHAAVEELRSIIVSVEPEWEVKDTLDAMKVLNDLGHSPTPTGKRFLEQMQREEGLSPEAMVPSKAEREQQRRQDARHQEFLTRTRVEAERLLKDGTIDMMMAEKELGGQSREDAVSRAKGAGIVVDDPSDNSRGKPKDMKEWFKPMDIPENEPTEDLPSGEGVESEEEAQARRDRELEEMKSELGKRPE